MSGMYDDIINTEYPLANHDFIRHPRMALEDRAKIFSPFAALKGYEDAISNQSDLAQADTSYSLEDLEDFYS